MNATSCAALLAVLAASPGCGGSPDPLVGVGGTLGKGPGPQGETGGAGGGAGAESSAGRGGGWPSEDRADGPPIAGRKICDGSEGITFGHAVEDYADFSGDTGDVAGVQSQLGRDAFFVNGRCEFWVTNIHGVTKWAASKTGVLTAEEERRLSEDFAYGLMPYAYGEHGTATLDGGTRTTFDGKGSVKCLYLCDKCPLAAPRGGTLHGSRWAKELFDRGANVEGPLRLRVAAWPLDESKELPLTLSRALSDYSASGTPGSVSILVDAASDQAALRGLRARLLAGDAGSPPAFHVLAPSGERFMPGFRDYLPFEKADGGFDRPVSTPVK